MTSDEPFDDEVSAWLDGLNPDYDPADERPHLVQFDDGRWAVVDEYGFAGEPVALNFAALGGAANSALRVAAIDIDPGSVTDVELEQ